MERLFKILCDSQGSVMNVITQGYENKLQTLLGYAA